MDETLLTAEELARLYRTSKNQIYNIIHRGGEGVDIPPSIRVGRRRLWVKSAVIDWLAHQVKSNQAGEIETQVSAQKLTINRI